jgi:hypothetical protein
MYNKNRIYKMVIEVWECGIENMVVLFKREVIYNNNLLFAKGLPPIWLYTFTLYTFQALGISSS